MFAERMFAARHHEDLQEKVSRALQAPGRQLLLYGDAGAGKTSLVLVACWASGLSGVRIGCGQPFETMATNLLAVLGRHQSEETTDQIAGEAEAGISIWGMVTSKAKLARGRTTKYTKYQGSVADQLIEALRWHRLEIVFFDDFENLRGKEHEAATTQAIAELMKTVADQRAYRDDAPTVVVAGIRSASASLMGLGQSVGRRVAQIAVPRMPPEELNEILVRGEQRLNMRFDDDVRDQIIAMSDGFPYYVHLFALHAVSRALRQGRAEVIREDFEDSLSLVLSDCALELEEQFNNSIEVTGALRMRSRVIDALATTDQPEMSLGDIRLAFARIFPREASEERLARLGKTVRALRDSGMLVDSGRSGSRNTYRFAHPLMRAYVRIRRLQTARAALEHTIAPF